MTDAISIEAVLHTLICLAVLTGDLRSIASFDCSRGHLLYSVLCIKYIMFVSECRGAPCGIV